MPQIAIIRQEKRGLWKIQLLSQVDSATFAVTSEQYETNKRLARQWVTTRWPDALIMVHEAEKTVNGKE